MTTGKKPQEVIDHGVKCAAAFFVAKCNAMYPSKVKIEVEAGIGGLEIMALAPIEEKSTKPDMVDK